MFERARYSVVSSAEEIATHDQVIHRVELVERRADPAQSIDHRLTTHHPLVVTRRRREQPQVVVEQPLGGLSDTLIELIQSMSKPPSSSVPRLSALASELLDSSTRFSSTANFSDQITWLRLRGLR